MINSLNYFPITIYDICQRKYHDVVHLKKIYKNNKPFPHIVLDNFVDKELLDNVLNEFPDLSKIEHKRSFNEPKQIKFGSIGFKNLSEAANQLISFLIMIFF